MIAKQTVVDRVVRLTNARVRGNSQYDMPSYYCVEVRPATRESEEVTNHHTRGGDLLEWTYTRCHSSQV